MPRRKRHWAGGDIKRGIYWIDRYHDGIRCRFSTKCRTLSGAETVLAAWEKDPRSARRVLGAGEETDLHGAVNAYIEYSAATNGRKHVRSQGSAFERWTGFLAMHGVTTLEALTPSIATEFIQWRKAGGAAQLGDPESPPRPVGEAAVNRDLAAMMALYSWHRDSERLPDECHPFRRVHLLREHHDINPHRVVDREHVMRVVEWFAAPVRNSTRRSRGGMSKWADAVLVLYGTAFRWGSFVRMTLGEIDARASILRDPKPKGRTAVEVGASEAVLEAAKRCTGRRYPDDEAQQLCHRLEVACRALGLPRFTAHDLRVSAATFMHQAGVSLRDLQHILGHASLKTTERYVRASSRLAQGPV